MDIALDPSADAADLTPQAQFDVGRAAANRVAPTDTARFALAQPQQRDVVDYVRSTQEGRLPELFGLRMERLSASPFAFFRGSAGIMAADLAAGPSSGLLAQLCGDAHANNFGLYGTDDGRIVMDINDFDETIVGPWEWDLKRLVASLVLAGRESGASRKQTDRAARTAVTAYRRAVKRLAQMPYDSSYVAVADEVRLTGHEKLGDEFEAALRKARRNTSDRVVDKSVEHIDDPTSGVSAHRFVDDEPVLFHVDDDEARGVVEGVRRYYEAQRASRRPLLSRYRIVDVAFRVVGTGSVGMRSYVVLLAGNDDDWLVLQVKQAAPSNLAGWLDGRGPAFLQQQFEDEGERIVTGARIVQARTDHLLGSTSIDGVPYIVRQFRNAKGSIDPLDLAGQMLDDFGQVCAVILARGHTRTLHPSALRGYLKGAKDLDEALAAYAQDYADQVERDHGDLLAAQERGAFADLHG